MTVGLPEGVSYLNLAEIYASANHRAMTQQGIFEVSFSIEGDTILQNGPRQQFLITVLPTTWPLIAAYKHGRKKYLEAMEPESERKARWNDFKVFMNTEHKSLQGIRRLANGCSYTSQEGEYQYSSVYGADGNGVYTFHMTGNNILTGTIRSFSMMQQYDDRDNTDRDTGIQSTDYHLLNNDSNSDNEQELVENGDLPPYNSVNLQLPEKDYFLHAFGSSSVNTGYAKLTTGNIHVPFGLVKVRNFVEGAAASQLIIKFKSGDHKGIKLVKV